MKITVNNKTQRWEQDVPDDYTLLTVVHAICDKIGVDCIVEKITEINNMESWISVEEQKPNNNDYVLVFCEHGVTLAEYTTFNSGNELWWAVYAIGTYEDSREAKQVTHWMPLPKPPKK